MIRIGIVYSPDPIYMNPYINQLIREYRQNIVLVIETQGSIVKKKTRKESLVYFLTLLLILGIKQTISHLWKFLMFKLGNFNSIKETCKDQEIPFFQVSTVNSKHAHFLLKEYDLDLIFNQSQHIVRKTVLDIPRIGVFNRHGALLPRFRGRLAPFWQLYFGEKQGGITYHLLDEKIDNGPIILQEAIPIARGETINSLILKMFRVAIRLFGSVIDFFEQSDFQEHLSPNPESEASYFSTPTIRDAIRYRFRL